MSIFHPTLLTDRAVIKANGKDVSKLLQDLLTCNMEHLAQTGDIVYGFLLTPQGRFLHEIFVIKTDDGFLLDTQAENAGQLLKRLKIYTLKREANFVIDNEQAVLACANALESVPNQIITSDSRHPALGYRVYGSKELLVTAANDKPPNYHGHRIGLCITDACDFIPEKTLLLDYDVDVLGGVDFEKGCYIGQEVTARMHYRGINKKGLYCIEADGTKLARLTIGTPILAGDSEAGKVLSVVGGRGIAMIRHEYAKAALLADDEAIKISRPDWAMKEKSA